MMLLAIAAACTVLAGLWFSVRVRTRDAIAAETDGLSGYLRGGGHELTEWRQKGGRLSTRRAGCVQCGGAASVRVIRLPLVSLIRPENGMAPRCPGPVQVTR